MSLADDYHAAILALREAEDHHARAQKHIDVAGRWLRRGAISTVDES